MSDQELPDEVNKSEEDQPKNPKGKSSSNGKNKSNSPEAGRKQSENAKLQRPKTAADRKSSKQPTKYKETRETAVRRDFQTGLNKLSYNETREIGMSEVQNVISNNRTPQDLRTYISALCDQDRNLNSATKEMEVLVFAYIASQFKEDLLDPIDKPPNLIKTVVRVCEAVHSYFKDTTGGVQKACARTLNAIYSSCLQNQAADTVKIVIAEPLLSILNGGADKATQQTAAICLCEFAGLLSRLGKKDLLDDMCDKIYTIFLKTNQDFVELIRAVGICMASNNLAKISDRLPGMINKLCAIAGSNNQSNQYYQNKIEACNSLGIIGKILANPDVHVNGDLKKIYDKVSELLKGISKNKILNLQKAGASALKQWDILLRVNAADANEDDEKILLPEEEEALKVQEELKSKQPPEKLEMPSRNNFRDARDQLKKEKQGNQEDAKDQKIEDFIKDAQSKRNRGQNYTRARSGIGGGHVAWSPPAKNGKATKEKAHANQKKSLKDEILQNHINRPKTAGNNDDYFPDVIWGDQPATKDENRTPVKKVGIETEDSKPIGPSIDKDNEEKKSRRPQTTAVKKTQEVDDKTNRKEETSTEKKLQRPQTAVDKKTQENGDKANKKGESASEKKLQRPQTAVDKKTQDVDDRAVSKEGSSAAKQKQTKPAEPKSAQKGGEDPKKKSSEKSEPKSADGVRESSNLRNKDKKNINNEKSIVSNEDIAEGKNLSESSSEKQLNLGKSTKKFANKDLNSSGSSAKTPRKIQRLNNPDNIQDDCFKDVKIETQNNKIGSDSKLSDTHDQKQDVHAMSPNRTKQQQHPPNEHVEKIAIQPSSHREKAAAVRQPKPMIRKNVQPQQNNTQHKEMTDQEIEELLTKADSNLDRVKEKEKKEADEAVKRQNDELLKKKAQDEIEHKRQEYKKPVPKSFDQNLRYKLFEVDVPIEKALAYFVDNVLPSGNNEIRDHRDPTESTKTTNEKPRQKEVPKSLPQKQDAVKENHADDAENEQHTGGNPALFGIAMGNQNTGKNNNVPKRRFLARGKASNSENVEHVVNKPLIVEEEENHHGEKRESPTRHADSRDLIANFEREDMDHMGTQLNQAIPQRTNPNKMESSQGGTTEHITKKPIMTNIRPPQNHDSSLELIRPLPVLDDKDQAQKAQVKGAPINSSAKADKSISQNTNQGTAQNHKDKLLNSQQFSPEDSLERDYVTKKPTKGVVQPPNQQSIGNKLSNPKQPAAIKKSDAWDERPISGSKKIGYSMPEGDSQNEDELDHEQTDSLNTFHRVGNSQYNDAPNLNNNPADPRNKNIMPKAGQSGNQNASLSKSSGVRLADERPIQNSKTRQPAPQDTWDERPIHSSSKTGYSIPNEDSQNEDELDHEPVAHNNQYHNASNINNNPADPRNKNPQSNNSKPLNNANTNVMSTNDHPANQNANTNKNSGVRSADVRPLQNSKARQPASQDAWDERPVHSSSKTGYSILNHDSQLGFEVDHELVATNSKNPQSNSSQLPNNIKTNVHPANQNANMNKNSGVRSADVRPIQNSKSRQPVTQDAWDERPIHNSSKMSYSVPNEDSQNEDELDHEPMASNNKNPQSNNSKLLNNTKANVHPTNQSANINNNSRVRSANERPLQSSKVRQPASQDAWDERPIHRGSKMDYSIPNEDSQNEDELDHEPVASNSKNPQPNSSKLQNGAKANVTSTNINPGNQSASLNKNPGVRSTDERPIQNIKARQSVPQDAWDERPLHSGSKMGNPIPENDSQNEDELYHEPVANNNQYHNPSNENNNSINLQSKKPLPNSSQLPNGAKTNVMSTNVNAGKQNASLNKNSSVHSAEERPIQNTGGRRPVSEGAYQNEDHQVDVAEESFEQSNPRASQEKQSNVQNNSHIEEPYQQLPSEVFNKHVDNVIQRTGIKPPQNLSPDISVGGHVDPIHGMLGLEDIIRDQIKLHLQKILPSRSESKDNTPSAKADRSATQITKSPESKVSERSSPNFRQEQLHEASIPQDRQTAISKAISNASQGQNKNQTNPTKLPEQPLNSAILGVSQGYAQPTKPMGVDKQVTIQQVQGSKQNGIQNDRIKKPDPLGSLGNSIIGERRLSDSNWLTPTAQNMVGLLKGNDYVNKNIQEANDTLGYGSTEEDEVDQRQKYQTLPAQIKSYNNHVRDRALNGNYQIDQKQHSEPIKYETTKKSPGRNVESVRTSYQNLSAPLQKPSGITSSLSVDKPQDSSALEQWQMALSLIEEGKYETAFSNILQSGDDIYLLRLMKVTGPCLKNLSRATATKLMSRLTLLMSSDFMAKIGVGFLENAQHHGLIKNLQIGHQHELMKAVQDISLKQTSLGAKSSKLMLRIENDLKSI